MKGWIKRVLEPRTEHVEVTGTPVAEGTELVTCSFCHSVTPTIAFYDHVRAHGRVEYAEGQRLKARGGDE